MAGYPLTKAVIDSRAGQLAVMARDLFRNIADFKLILDGLDDTALTALGYETADITVLRASFAALGKLGQIANAQATQPAASDFFFDARHLMGAS